MLEIHLVLLQAKETLAAVIIIVAIMVLVAEVVPERLVETGHRQLAEPEVTELHPQLVTHPSLTQEAGAEVITMVAVARADQEAVQAEVIRVKMQMLIPEVEAAAAIMTAHGTPQVPVVLES